MAVLAADFADITPTLGSQPAPMAAPSAVATRRGPIAPSVAAAQRLTTMTRFAESSVRYELRRLKKLGVLVARRGGREKYFRINDRHPLFPEFKQMVYKTAGLGETIRQAVDAMPDIHAAFIFGSVAKGGEQATSDIDLFILGKPDQTLLAAALSEAEGRLGREINLVTMAPR